MPRIIPAYAGSTVCLQSDARREWDHPRVCGEHSCAVNGHHPNQGSSPRMRGARRVQRCSTCTWGIIPAYAGSTVTSEDTATPTKDHPRVCGEHIAQVFARGV